MYPRTTLKCLVLCGLLTSGLVSEVRAASVLAGSDYLTTVSAEFDFGGAIGLVPLTGAFGPGVTDTVVTRLRNAILPAVSSSDTIRIQMRLLALNSVAPALVGGSFFDVFVDLNPRVPSLGEMTINHEDPDNGTPASEGTFTSEMTVNFIASFVPVAGGSPFSVRDSLLLTTIPAALWSHEPPPGALLVPGPPGDLDANLHAPLPPGFNDFFPILVLERHPGRGVHEAGLAIQQCSPGDERCQLAEVVPEPSTYLLALSGFALLLAGRRKRRQN